ncbi:glycerophosphodiester phosphodiesterase [Dysgonomonas macrotermitis]|uniref:Glycerophosphoryl diester phosphodiesterase n=1 Tax=Dysgonomonas macrotermitis TaxID=1346286 RepID=A0A1M4TN86_9BACT|nr:glycerophosphodiester phosphodiesterase family protein [Dysgonomonas macrotermitis]SHE45757.1 glycerophosphoryl diester phosphodiesterase [Dysgonomonas macrotermitis]
MINKKVILSALCCIMLSVSVNINSQTKVIAHRGYWDCEGSAQNSIAALNKAHEIGVYGSEFDVIITPDGVPVVNHDDVIEGMRIEDTPYERIKDLKLKNGETLPTLEQYLIAGKANEGTQLILEIKPHREKVNEDRAVAATLALVTKYNLQKQVEYISFSMNICKELLRQSPESQIAYLEGELSPKEIKEIGLTGIDYHYSVFEKHPDWIIEAKSLGLSINAWTVNDPLIMKTLIDQQVDFITTDKPVEAQALLR